MTSRPRIPEEIKKSEGEIVGVAGYILIPGDMWIIDPYDQYKDPISRSVKYLLGRMSEGEQRRWKALFDAIPPGLKKYWGDLTGDYGLPYGWGRLWNLIFALMLGYSAMRVIAERKFTIPSDKSVSERMWARIFRLYLGTHTVYYLIEISATRIYEIQSSLAHHIISMIMFWCFRTTPEYYSLLLITPFYIHSLAWLLNDAEGDSILLAYNIANFVCIGYGMCVPVFMRDSSSAKFRIKQHTALSIATALLLISNMWSYCSSYSDDSCGTKDGSYKLGLNQFTAVVFMSAMCTTLAITSIFAVAKGGSKSYITPHRRKSILAGHEGHAAAGREAAEEVDSEPRKCGFT